MKLKNSTCKASTKDKQKKGKTAKKGVKMTEKTNTRPYDKLVRDKIPEIIKNSNRIPECKILDEDEEYTQYLIRKLQEEVQEFMENPCVEELADIKEVVDSLSRIRKFQDV
jgi:predicted house-cleaning noncanonical NTP pyrophosphatase (MazG superfamily)